MCAALSTSSANCGLGVKPMGENGGYYQVVPVKNVKLDIGGAKIVVDGNALTPGADFHPFPGIEGLPFAIKASVASAPVVFGGRLGAPDAIKPADARGKVVVFSAPVTAPPPPGRGGPGGPTWRVFDFRDAVLSYRGAAALVVASFELTPPQVWNLLDGEEMQLVGDAKPDSNAPMMIVTKAGASRLLGARIDSAKVGQAGKTASVSFGQLYTDPPAPARNVVAVIEGSDPKLKTEFVVVSAHSDHIGISDEKADHDSLRLADILTRPMGVETPARPLSPSEQARFAGMLDSVRKMRPAREDSIANGADDDGSGSMGLLELAEYFQAAPQKTETVDSVRVERRGREGAVWLRMVHRSSDGAARFAGCGHQHRHDRPRCAPYDIENGGPNYLQILGSRRLSTEYGNWVEEVNARPEFSFKFDYQFDANGHPQQYYCRSDHWNFARWSIPTVFFSTGSHVDYHMVTDEPQYIDYNHYANVVQFVGALAADVAGRPNRAVIDKPRPDPHGACKQ